MLGFDPVYFLFLAPAVLLGVYAQLKVRSAYASAQQSRSSSGLSGAAAAYDLLRIHGLSSRVRIEQTQGLLGDHYDPQSKTLRLSPDVYNGRSLAAVGIAAHEVGHALQDRARYGPLRLRNGIIPLASVGPVLSIALIMIGALFQSLQLVLIGIIVYSAVVLFQLVNLPVEFDASRRARRILIDCGIIAADELPVVRRVLGAAALTYVAATLSAIFTLLYFLFRAGLLGGRDD